MNYISDVLFWISTGLLVPVIVLLIWFFIRALLLLGGFFGQYVSMRKWGNEMKAVMEATDADSVCTLAERMPKSKSVASAYMLSIVEARHSSAKVEYQLKGYAQYLESELSLPSTLLKMGPMLGLMGTLIPMGPALVGLSTGDIASMAYNMQVAFATTVVGIFASAIGFVVKQTRQRWHAMVMSQLEYVADLIDEHNKNSHHA